MSRRPPDKSVLDEVRRLRAQLDPRRFQPLGPGLGLGRVRPAAPKQPASQVPTPAPTPIPAPVVESPVAISHPAPSESVPVGVYSPLIHVDQSDLSSPDLKPQSARRSRGWFMIYACDVAIVAATVLTGAFSVELLTGTEVFPLTWQSVQTSLPAMVVRELGYARSLVGFLILFIVYWLFFRIVAGSTLGEFFIKVGIGRRQGKRVTR